MAYFPGKSRINSDYSFRSKNDSVKSQLPFLTFHIGCALAFPDTKFQFVENSGLKSSMHLQNDFLHPNNYYVPKCNIMIAIKNSYHFTSDIFFVLTKESPILEKDVQLGEHVFNSGTTIHSRFNFFAGNFSYIHPVSKNKKYHLGVLIGLAGAHASFSLDHSTDKSISANRSLWFVNPIVGLDIYGFLTKKIFYRTAIKFSTSPINNYSYTYFTFKPYIEYHLFKNIGVGLRMDYMNMSIKDIDQKRFKGQLKMEIPSISVVGVYRFFNSRKHFIRKANK